MKTSYVIGIGIVAVLAVTLAAAGFQYLNSPSTTTVTTSSATFLSTQSGTLTSGSVTSTGSTTQSTEGSSTGSGHFAMMATDPPIAASGVSEATVTYSGMAVQSTSGAGASGWTELSGSGTLNLMSSVNVSQTIASAQVQSGTYDAVAMNITSGTVVYDGQTYSAAIVSGNLKVNLHSDVQVNSSASGAAIIDLRTFVFNSGSASSPQFFVQASGEATAVPPSFATNATLQVGATASLHGQTWWTGFEDQTATKVSITSATLTGDSLSIQVANSGNASGVVQAVIVTPVSADASATTSLPASFNGSAVFTVGADGSIQASNTLQGSVLLGGQGSAVGVGSDASLNFSGTISLNFGQGTLQIGGVAPGQTYLITVMGANTYASTTVVAQ